MWSQLISDLLSASNSQSCLTLSHIDVGIQFLQSSGVCNYIRHCPQKVGAIGSIKNIENCLLF